jgi:stage II sporulation protein D
MAKEGVSTGLFRAALLLGLAGLSLTLWARTPAQSVSDLKLNTSPPTAPVGSTLELDSSATLPPNRPSIEAANARVAAVSPQSSPPTSAVASPDPLLTVSILSRFRPQQLNLRGSGLNYRLERRQQQLTVNGVTQDALRLESGRWCLNGPGLDDRCYSGALKVTSGDAALSVVLSLPVDAYVAEVVEAESDPQTPAAALEALAVVVRAFALGTGLNPESARHPDAMLCDLAHCQVFRPQPGPGGERARRAVLKTSGWKLLLDDGRAAVPVFHAACAGATARPLEVFGGEDRTGAATVPDPGCRDTAWKVRLSRASADAAISPLLPPIPGQFGPVSGAGLVLERGSGGYVARAVDPRSGRWVSGEVLSRALDGVLGWGHVRSACFRWRWTATQVVIEGQGLGHGVGLCQRGAARRAREGADAAAILEYYLPRTRLERSPAGQEP